MSFNEKCKENKMDRYQGRAESIIRQAERKGKPLAVFKVADSFRSAVMDDSVDVHASNFVGVYDENCQVEWLEHDLVWAAGRGK